MLKIQVKQFTSQLLPGGEFEVIPHRFGNPEKASKTWRFNNRVRNIVTMEKISNCHLKNNLILLPDILLRHVLEGCRNGRLNASLLRAGSFIEAAGRGGFGDKGVQGAVGGNRMVISDGELELLFDGVDSSSTSPLLHKLLHQFIGALVLLDAGCRTVNEGFIPGGIGRRNDGLADSNPPILDLVDMADGSCGMFGAVQSSTPIAGPRFIVLANFDVATVPNGREGAKSSFITLIEKIYVNMMYNNIK